MNSAEKFNQSVDNAEDKEGSSWMNPGVFPEFAGNNDSAVVEKKEEEKTEAEKMLARLSELKSAAVPEGKFKLPDECFDEVMKDIIFMEGVDSPGQYERLLDVIEGDIARIEKTDGKIEKEIGDRLWALFNDPEISIGIHGTLAEADSNLGSADSTFLKDGLGCRHGDLRKTVAFKDRGMIHAHGNISFAELLSYGYPYKSLPLTVKKWVETEHSFEKMDVSARKFSAIVAIPRSFDTFDGDLFSGKKEIAIASPAYEGKKIDAKLLKPEFIVGVVSDSDMNSIVWNPNFDLENLHNLSKQKAAKKKAEAERRTLEEQQKEAARQAEEAAKASRGWFKRLFGRRK